MFKFVAFFACVTVALAAPGLVTEHHTVVQEPVLTKVGAVVHSVPSATSHQSFTRVHNKAVVAPVVTPVVKTTVHAAPVVPVVKTVEPVVPVVKTVVAAPVVKTVVPAVPVVKTVAPVVPVVGNAVSHQSHVQIHSNAAVVAPVLHSVPVVHAAHLLKSTTVSCELYKKQHQFPNFNKMFKSITIIALFCLAAANAGLIETHHVVQEPVLTKVGAVVHSVPSATSHQSFTRVHNKAVVSPIVTPVVKTTVHAAPIVKTVEHVPVVKTVDVPVVKTVEHVPVVKTVQPVVHVHSAPTTFVHSAPIVHTAPVVKTFAPAAYTIHH
ncbi:uncharacterized protein [Musca autumnalis]|uniref:uncharacterized protein n=1 Tax=Musca autumnalis TaxID=221902 RepID=UPI003CF002CA